MDLLVGLPLIRAMIVAGSAIMAYNIIRYTRFMRNLGSNTRFLEFRARFATFVGFILLVFFLIGYLAVLFSASPSFVISCILLGGSIFVTIVLWIMFTLVWQVSNAQRTYESAAGMNNLGIFRYDPAADTITFMADKYTTEFRKRYGIPETVQGVSLTPPQWVHPHSVTQFKRIFTSAAAGHTPCETNILCTAGDEAPDMFHIVLKNMRGKHEARHEPLIGTARDITKRWRLLNQYREETEYFPNLKDPSLIFKAHFDLTSNRMLAYFGSSLPDTGQAQPHDATAREDTAQNPPFHELRECIRGIINAALTEQDRNMLTTQLDTAYLLEEFRRGRTTLSWEFECARRLDLPSWMMLEMHLYDQLESSNVGGFLYVYDTSRAHLEQSVMARLLDLGFTDIGFIDIQPNEPLFCSYSYDGGTGKVQWIPFKDRIDVAGGAYMTEAQKATVLEKTMITNILDGLERNGGHHQITHTANDAAGQTHIRQLDYCWLNKKRQSILYLTSDITERYERTQQQIKTLEQTNQAMIDFVAQLNHDVRTPVGIIKNMLDFAEQDIGNPEKLKTDLVGIRKGEEFLLSLIDDVIEISEIDRGSAKLSMEPISYERFTQGIEATLKLLCEDKGLRWSMDGSNEMGIAVLDAARLRRISLNLIGNAVKYTPGGSVACTIDWGRTADGHGLFTFSVADTGIGMSKEFTQRMFKSFTEELENPYRTSDMKGTGLGLAIVKRNVDLMGGTIDVTSAVGGGTTVTVTIQCDRVDVSAGEGEKPDESRQQTVPKKLKGTLLVAEDNAINREIVTRILVDLGVTVVVAQDGKQAYQTFTESAPGTFQALLMDILMPMMDGYEATDAIRHSQHPDAASVPIIALTASAFKEAERQGLQAGMTDYLTKPINATQLYRKLAAYLKPAG